MHCNLTGYKRSQTYYIAVQKIGIFYSLPCIILNLVSTVMHPQNFSLTLHYGTITCQLTRANPWAVEQIRVKWAFSFRIISWYLSLMVELVQSSVSSTSKVDIFAYCGGPVIRKNGNHLLGLYKVKYSDCWLIKFIVLNIISYFNLCGMIMVYLARVYP